MSESSPTPRFGWKKALLFSLIPIVILLLLFEGAARVREIWSPPMTADIGQGFTEDSRLFVPHPQRKGMLVTHPRKLAAFVNQEFPEQKKRGTCRVFFLGGSSVNYLHHEFPALAERLAEATDCREVEFINCGGLSYGSGRLVLVAAEILAYEPDLICIYSGHNEFEELDQLVLADLNTLPLQRLIDSSAQLRFLRDQVASHAISEMEAERNLRILEDARPDTARAWAHTWTPEEVEDRMEVYEANLENIVTLARQQGVPVVIGTVPSNLYQPLLGADDRPAYAPVVVLMGEERFEEAAKMGSEVLGTVPRHQSSGRENAIIRAIAETHGLPLADVEAAVIAAEPGGMPGRTLFNDHCHLNQEGNRVLIEAFEPVIAETLRQR